jgi:hypothetical protein
MTNSATTYHGPFSLVGNNTTEANVQYVMPAGTLSYFCVYVGAAPAVGRSWTFTVRVNGANTAVTTTISNPNVTNCDTTHTASFNGTTDKLSVSVTPSGSPGTTPGAWVANYQ